jgi:radical SAM protein with 4Fe4S-binding SPASM domain
MEKHLRVYMDINNKCNLKCTMCYFALDLRKVSPVTMSLELFGKIASQVFPRAVSVNLSCAAEPLIVPDLPDYLEIAAGYDIPSTLMVTNAFFLTDRMISAVIGSGLKQIDISIDGASKNTYESIRVGSDLDRVVNNVRALQSAKKERGAAYPLLYLDFALMRSNFRELPDFLRLAKELGAYSVRANHLIPFKKLGNFKDSLVHCKEDANKVFDETRALAKVLGLNVKIPRNFRPENCAAVPVVNKPSCRVPFDSATITSDGRVLPCVWFPLKEMCAGDLNTQPFDEIWNGPVYSRLRKDFSDKKYTRYCENCPAYGDEDLSSYVFRERSREDVLNISATGV